MAYATGSRSSTFRFNPLRQHLPRLKGNDPFLGHDYIFPRARIAGSPSFPPPHLEDTEVTKFDSAIPSERVHDGVEQIVNDLARLDLCKAKLLGNHSDDVFSGHDAILLA
jgi:hypothetical protein